MDCAGALLEALPGVMWFVRRQMRSRRAKGMSVAQFRTLVQLRRSPAVSLSHVAETLGSTLPTVSRVVSGLVRRGYVLRQTCPQDRRQVTLRLTPKGTAALEAAWGGTQQTVAERFDGLPERQRAELLGALLTLQMLFARPGSDEMSASETG